MELFGGDRKGTVTTWPGPNGGDPVGEACRWLAVAMIERAVRDIQDGAGDVTRPSVADAVVFLAGADEALLQPLWLDAQALFGALQLDQFDLARAVEVLAAHDGEIEYEPSTRSWQRPVWERRQRVLQLYSENLSVAEIARRVGRPYHGVYNDLRVLKREGVIKNRKRSERVRKGA